MSNESERLLISGAGAAGLSLAVGLKDAPYEVVLVDQNPVPDKDFLAQDTRQIALSKRSQYYLESIGIWDSIKSYVTPIEKVHVSEKGFRTSVMLNAADHELDDFGGLIPLGRLILTLHEAIESQDNLLYLPDTKLLRYYVDHEADEAVCHFKNSEAEFSHAFKWMIAAEGTHSTLREMAGIQTAFTDYDQVAVIAVGTFEKPHNNIAYERFTSRGPLALLPVNTHEMAIILTVKREERAKWETASDSSFSDEVLFRIGAELGMITSVTKRHVWDLKLMVPKTLCAEYLTLAGNSAHALHPIAGQGLNLGFRDCAALIPYFQEKRALSLADFRRYERERRTDIFAVTGATDFLVRAFDIELFPVPYMRNLALRGVKCIKPLRKKIAQFGMGVK